jgi:hypothetical protein
MSPRQDAEATTEGDEMTAMSTTTTTTEAPALVKDDTFTARPVHVGLNTEVADARWYTSDGYVVYRTGPYRYWAKEQSGRFACHGTLTDARDDIAWLRARGR